MSNSSVLEKTKEAIQNTSASNLQAQSPEEARAERADVLTRQMEEKIKQALRDTKASPELQIEARELMHDMAARIGRIKNAAKTEDAFERDVYEAVTGAVSYLKSKAKAESKKDSKEKPDEKPASRHNTEKPEVPTVSEAIKDQSPLPIQEKPSPFTSQQKPLEKPMFVKTAPTTTISQAADNTTKQLEKMEKKPTNVSVFAVDQEKLKKHIDIAQAIKNDGDNDTAGESSKTNKKQESEELFRHQAIKSLQSPEELLREKFRSRAQKIGDRIIKGPSNRNSIIRTTLSTKDIHEDADKAEEEEKEKTSSRNTKEATNSSYRKQLGTSLENPEEYWRNKTKQKVDSVIKKFIAGPKNRNSIFREKLNARDEKKKETKTKFGIPLSSLIISRRPISTIREDTQVAEYSEPLMDRGTGATGNPRMQTATIYPGTPPKPLEETYSVPRSTRNAAPQYGDEGGGGMGGGGKPRKKKKKKTFEEKLIRRAAKELLMIILRSPVFWAIFGAIVIIILLLALIIGGKAAEEEQQTASIPITITKSGPLTASVGQNLVYTINVGYQGQAEDLTIIDKFPIGVKYISSSPIGEYDAVARTVTWNAKTLNMQLANPVNTTVTVTLQSEQNNLAVVNQATATVIASVSGSMNGVAGGYVAPSTNTCNQKYASAIRNNPTRLNFGDPVCDFTKDDLYTELRTDDPANADFWFNTIVPCESGYNPNAYAGPQTGTPDAAGAWGLYQMGSSNPPGSPLSSPGKNGPNDRGDVPWRIQTLNATTYGKRLASLGAYWACARNNRAN